MVYDKTFLVIPNPGKNEKLSVQVAKVLAPFSASLWFLLIIIILFTALMSVWFAARTEVPQDNHQRRISSRKRKVYARLALDSFLEKGSYFFSAGVDNDSEASLPNKFLMFGFGFFILITVSTYVANLAAFLTRNITTTKTMEGVIAAGKNICAHPALKTELQSAWPKAKFYFTETGNEFHGIVEDYDLGRCEVLAIGWEDTSLDSSLMKKFCERDLLFTNSLLTEIPLAFPIRTELASGFSYWMLQGEKFHDLTITKKKDEYSKEHGNPCNVELSVNRHSPSNALSRRAPSENYAKITVKMMVFPIIFFLSCTLLAVVLQLFHQRYGRRSYIGQVSVNELNLVSEKSSRKLAFADRGERRISSLAMIEEACEEKDDFSESTLETSFGKNK